VVVQPITPYLKVGAFYIACNGDVTTLTPSDSIATRRLGPMRPQWLRFISAPCTALLWYLLPLPWLYLPGLKSEKRLFAFR